MDELDIEQSLAQFDKEWEKNDRANTRGDRHTQLSLFTWEDSHFATSGDIEAEAMNRQLMGAVFSSLSPRQRKLLWQVAVEGYTFTEIARVEEKSESAIRKAYNRAVVAARKVCERIDR